MEDICPKYNLYIILISYLDEPKKCSFLITHWDLIKIITLKSDQRLSQGQQCKFITNRTLQLLGSAILDCPNLKYKVQQQH